MDLISSLSTPGTLLPHGYCFTWNPALLWSMVGADAVIALAYFSIPVAIVSFVRQRPALASNWVPWLFCAFIFACGITHVMDIWTIWIPDYRFQAVTKVATAGISLATAFVLWPLMPDALKLPTAADYRRVRGSLEAETVRRRGAEETRDEIEQALAATLDSIDAGYISSDREGRVVRMNAVAERLTGWREGEARGQSVWQVFEREGRVADATGQTPIDYLISQGFEWGRTMDVIAVARDGERRPVNVHAAITHSAEGEARSLVLVLRDLSRLHSAESAATQMAALVASSNDAIISKSLTGRIQTWNPAAENLFGYSAAEAIGQSIGIIIPDDRLDEEERILAKLQSGEVVPPFESLRRTRDGRLVPMSLTMSPIRDGHGVIIGASKIARDVTAQRKAEIVLHRLEAENRQIQESNRLKNLFLANMSHELRTPLNAIIGFADLLESGAVPASSPKFPTFMGYIGTSGRHLLKLINDVLDLAKVESGRFEFSPSRLSLKALIGEVTDVLKSLTTRKVLRVEIDIDPSVDELVLDPGRLRQVLYNYLSNAIKFSHEGGLISVRARPDGERHFRLEVEDRGIGIAAEDLPRLFREFQQLDSSLSKAHEGTGLGLALTRRLVEAQGGRVGVTSELGIGSVFSVVLNRVHGNGLRGSWPADAREPRLPHLLVVHSDSDERVRLVQALSAAGFVVDAAKTSDEAVARNKINHYDAMTLDLMLGQHEGLPTLASMREKTPHQAITVVGVSMEDSGMSFAVADILDKPLRVDEIVNAMAPFRLPAPGRANVMVIDDDPLALHLMKAALAATGVEAVCFEGGPAALAALDEVRPDCIILDLMMPGFDGFAVLDALSRRPAWKDTPVFIWTSMNLTDDEYESLSRSARAIARKGGGELDVMLTRLLEWSPPAVRPPAENPT